MKSCTEKMVPFAIKMMELTALMLQAQTPFLIAFLARSRAYEGAAMCQPVRCHGSMKFGGVTAINNICDSPFVGNGSMRMWRRSHTHIGFRNTLYHGMTSIAS
jgi:hypothetical protein